MKFKDILIGLFALLLVGGAAWLLLSPSGLQHAPDVQFKTVDGRVLDLKALRGRPVMVVFWATSCPGCIREMPHLIELYHKFHPRGLEIIGVAMAYDPPNHVMEMRKQKAIPYPISLDIDGALARAFGDVKLTPTSFVIDPRGRIVRHKIGEMDITALTAQLEAMLVPGGQG